MSATTITGSIYQSRQGDVGPRQSFKVSGNSSTTATTLPITIKASASAPVVVEAQVLVTTLDGGTTPTVSLGIDSTATQIINAASTATAATGGTFLPASNAKGKYVLTADTTLYYKQGGTPNGTGIFWFLIDVYQLNSAPIA